MNRWLTAVRDPSVSQALGEEGHSPSSAPGRGEVDRGVEEVSRSITLERSHLDTWNETRTLPGFLCSLEQGEASNPEARGHQEVCRIRTCQL